MREGGEGTHRFEQVVERLGTHQLRLAGDRVGEQGNGLQHLDGGT